MATLSPAYVTFAEYLLAEDRDDVKHEWLNGMVFAMTRSTPTHSLIGSNIRRLLGNGVGADCQVFDSEVCILVEQTHYATYADGSIVCGPIETTAVMKNGRSLGEAITNPVVLVEVLSRSTEKNDRGEKFEHYKRLPSLREYVLVGQDEHVIEHFVRKPDGSWDGTEAHLGGRVAIHGIAIAVDDVYRGVPLQK